MTTKVTILNHGPDAVHVATVMQTAEGAIAGEPPQYSGVVEIPMGAHGEFWVHGGQHLAVVERRQ